MIMQFQVLVTLLGCLQTVICRDYDKSSKLPPTITNSLVNLGKMEISFYINSKPDSIPKSQQSHNSYFSSMTPKRTSIFDEPCPCSNLRNIKDSFLSNPSDIINKILRSNDLFTNKSPAISPSCCDTIEHEDTVFFELIPNQKKTDPIKMNSYPPLLFDSLIPTRQVSPIKTKTVEIFLYPKRKDLTTFQLPNIIPKKNIVAKGGIQIVGDKTPKNDLKLVNASTSVKKDLTGSDRKDIVTNEVIQKEENIKKSNIL